ncbi:MAG: hypothetical protein U0821_13270 [Chloroflexota bacterium]
MADLVVSPECKQARDAIDGAMSMPGEVAAPGVVEEGDKHVRYVGVCARWPGSLEQNV